MENNLLKEASELQNQLVEWRRCLHQMPETGIHLPKTMAFIKEKLEEMGITYRAYEDIPVSKPSSVRGKDVSFCAAIWMAFR